MDFQKRCRRDWQKYVLFDVFPKFVAIDEWKNEEMFDLEDILEYFPVSEYFGKYTEFIVKMCYFFLEDWEECGGCCYHNPHDVEDQQEFPEFLFEN